MTELQEADSDVDGELRSRVVPLSVSSRHRESGVLRQRIIEVAAEMFANRGFSATSMREVAKRAGCTKPGLYYYFDGKAALFLAILREETERIRNIVENNLSCASNLRGRMRNAIRAYVDHIRAEPHALGVVMRAELHTDHGQPAFDFRSVRQMYREMSMAVLEQAVTEGEIRADVDLHDAFAAFIGMLDYRCRLWLADGEPIPEDYPDRVIALLFGGLAP